MRWLRRMLKQQELQRWVIYTPYGIMSGEGLPPMHIVDDMRRQGINVEVIVSRQLFEQLS